MKNISLILLMGVLTVSTQMFAENTPYTPESILPKGVDDSVSVNPYTGESGPARKGTVAATVNNVALLNKLLLAPQSAQNEKEIDQIIQTIEPLIPSLKSIGMFHFFTVSEWLADDKQQPGRALVGILYLEKFPQELNDNLRTNLNMIYRNSNNTLLKEHIKKVVPEAK